MSAFDVFQMHLEGQTWKFKHHVLLGGATILFSLQNLGEIIQFDKFVCIILSDGTIKPPLNQPFCTTKHGEYGWSFLSNRQTK